MIKHVPNTISYVVQITAVIVKSLVWQFPVSITVDDDDDDDDDDDLILRNG